MKHFRKLTVPFSDPDDVHYSDEDEDEFYCNSDDDPCLGEGGEGGHVWLRNVCIFCGNYPRERD